VAAVSARLPVQGLTNWPSRARRSGVMDRAAFAGSGGSGLQSFSSDEAPNHKKSGVGDEQNPQADPGRSRPGQCLPAIIVVRSKMPMLAALDRTTPICRNPTWRRRCRCLWSERHTSDSAAAFG